MIIKQKCNTCGESKPLTAEYFYTHGNSSTGYMKRCIFCTEEIRSGRKPLKIKEIKKRIEKLNMAREKKKNHKSIRLKRIYDSFNENEEYSIEVRKGLTKNTVDYTFKGKVIQKTNDLITLQKENGVKESFLYADFFTKDCILKEEIQCKC